MIGGSENVLIEWKCGGTVLGVCSCFFPLRGNVEWNESARVE